ncbi:MAG TPA: cyclohexa-1,5-dienecarbonyl-CoA hydratase [Planctomycetota bacterium]|nr:cyclohexa-1,5-dienecarbonyl-CoA hydratase [Planctomycetota bacterium]
MAVEPLASPIQVEHLDGGSLLLVRLARPKANIVDAAMTKALCSVFVEARTTAALAAVVLSAQGPHFSFGASVQEHLPDQVLGMLRGFHGLFRAIGEAAVPVFAAVRGQCLGGGLELAAFCHRLFAAPDAKFGQPEIKLGVFAPVASLLLPERIGRPAAEDLCLTGRTIDAAEALRLGLCDAVVEDPEAAALGHARERLVSHSASSLRHAVRAVRGPFLERFLPQLAGLERIYLNDLMATHDAREGIEAFLAKRAPVWRNA